MMQLLFPTPVVRTQLGLSNSERQDLKNKTLAVYGQLNSNRKPWSAKLILNFHQAINQK